MRRLSGLCFLAVCGFVVSGVFAGAAAGAGGIESEPGAGSDGAVSGAATNGVATARSAGRRPVVRLGVGYMSGYAAYEIGAELWWPLSRLEFPMNVAVVSAGVAFGTPRWKSLDFDVSGWANVTQESGTLKDSDWLPESPVRRVDVYSETDAELQSYGLQAEGTFRLRPGRAWALGLTGGVLGEWYRWEGRNTVQWSPSGLSGYAYESPPGVTTITYELLLAGPYGGVTADYSNGRFELALGLDVAPLAFIADEDDHLARSILSKTDTIGTLIMVSIDGTWRLKKDWSIRASGTARFLESGTGTQESTVYASTDEAAAGTTWKISHEMEMTAGSGLLYVLYEF